VNVRDSSSTPAYRAILETACWGIELQIWREMLNLERVGLIVFFFIPALWQVQSARPTLFMPKLRDGFKIE
jgi:hypothetical protein